MEESINSVHHLCKGCVEVCKDCCKLVQGLYETLQMWCGSVQGCDGKYGMNMYMGGIKVQYEPVQRWSDCALICSDACKCDPQTSSCPPLTAEQRISQIPVCHGIKYSHLKKLGMRMMICLKS